MYWRLFPQRWSGRGLKLNTHLHLLPMSRMVELYFHSPICLHGRAQGQFYLQLGAFLSTSALFRILVFNKRKSDTKFIKASHTRVFTKPISVERQGTGPSPGAVWIPPCYWLPVFTSGSAANLAHSHIPCCHIHTVTVRTTRSATLIRQLYHCLGVFSWLLEMFGAAQDEHF
jgi:hypothetical protein